MCGDVSRAANAVALHITGMTEGGAGGWGLLCASRAVVVGIEGRCWLRLGRPDCVVIPRKQMAQLLSSTSPSPISTQSPPIQLLVQHHTQHELRENCSGLQLHPRHNLLSYPPSISAASVVDSFSLLLLMSPSVQYSVVGAGVAHGAREATHFPPPMSSPSGWTATSMPPPTTASALLLG